MAYAQDIFQFWQANLALQEIQLFYGFIPANPNTGDPINPPYAVFVMAGTYSEFMTCPNYWERMSFSINYYSTSLADVERTSQLIMNNLDYARIADGAMALIRNNYFILQDPDSPKLVFHSVLMYDYLKNVALV